MRKSRQHTVESKQKPNAGYLLFVCCRLLPVILAAALVSGCVQKWAVISGTSEQPLQWPAAPEKPRIEFSSFISGFREAGASLSKAAQDIFVGESEDDKFVRPVAVAKGRDGRYAVADAGARLVRLFVPETQQYIKIRKTASGELALPVGVIFDDELRLYVSDSVLGGVFVYDKEGKFLFALDKTNSGPLQRPTGLAYNGEKKLLYVIDTAGNKITAFRPDGTEAFSFGDRGPGNGQYNFPTHIYYSQGGKLYVNDALNFRVQILDPAGGFLSLFGRHGDGTGDFAMPKGIAADKNGTIYVADALFDNIQLFSPEGKFLLTLGGRGSGPGEFLMPSGLFIDGDTLYVCDSFNGRVQIFKIYGL